MSWNSYSFMAGVKQYTKTLRPSGEKLGERYFQPEFFFDLARTGDRRVLARSIVTPDAHVEFPRRYLLRQGTFLKKRISPSAPLTDDEAVKGAVPCAGAVRFVARDGLAGLKPAAIQYIEIFHIFFTECRERAIKRKSHIARAEDSDS